MPQVAAGRVQWLTIVIAQVARGDDPKGADGRERPTLGGAKLVGSIAERDLLPLAVSRQVQVAHEDVARIETPFAFLGWPSTTPMAVESFRFSITSVVEQIVSIEHIDAPDMRNTHGHLKRGGHVSDRRVPQASRCRPPVKSG